MVRRRGLGASMVASVVFTVILVAALTVYASAQGREALYSTADAEDSLRNGFHILSAAEAANILLGVQGLVSSRPISCHSASADVNRGLTSEGDSQTVGELTVVAHADPAPDLTLGDNMSAIAPFNGSFRGDLNLAISVTGTGSIPPSVMFDKAETHYLHLDLHLALAASDCTSAVSAVETVLASSVVLNCSYADAAPVVDGAMQGPAFRARADGFRFSSSFAVASNGGCLVTFGVTVSQDGVPGLAGPFNAHFEQRGSALLPTSTP